MTKKIISILAFVVILSGFFSFGRSIPAEAGGSYKLPYSSGSSYIVTQAYNPSSGIAKCNDSAGDPLCSHNSNSNHRYAIDFALPLNTSVLASQGGTVYFVGNNSIYGNPVKCRPQTAIDKFKKIRIFFSI